MTLSNAFTKIRRASPQSIVRSANEISTKSANSIIWNHIYGLKISFWISVLNSILNTESVFSWEMWVIILITKVLFRSNVVEMS